MKKLILLLLVLAFLPIAIWGQEESAEPDHSYKPLTVKLDEGGKKYIRFITWHQMWLQGQTGQRGPAACRARSGRPAAGR